MTIQLKTQNLETTITVRGDDLVATPNILELVHFARTQKQQMEAAKKVYEDACQIIKDYMQDAQTLISEDGVRLATWIQQGKRVELDKDALKLNFADIYDICCITKDGNRPFCLK